MDPLGLICRVSAIAHSEVPCSSSQVDHTSQQCIPATAAGRLLWQTGISGCIEQRDLDALTRLYITVAATPFSFICISSTIASARPNSAHSHHNPMHSSHSLQKAFAADGAICWQPATTGSSRGMCAPMTFTSPAVLCLTQNG